MSFKENILISVAVTLMAAPVFARVQSRADQFSLPPMKFKAHSLDLQSRVQRASAPTLWFWSGMFPNAFARGEGGEERTPITLPTMQPTSRLRWDLTPLVPCPPGEHRVWRSFGAMPAAERVIAGYTGYMPDSLCAPVGGQPWLP